MTYYKWFQEHSKKHQKLIEKLRSKNLTDNQIIDYFDYDNMAKNEIDFCPLYRQHQKCHSIKHLNCFLCACPYFRFNDNGLYVKDGIVTKSLCSVNSKFSKFFVTNNERHLDCSSCKIPHTKAFMKNIVQKSWAEIMKNCNQ